MDTGERYAGLRPNSRRAQPATMLGGGQLVSSGVEHQGYLVLVPHPAVALRCAALPSNTLDLQDSHRIM